MRISGAVVHVLIVSLIHVSDWRTTTAFRFEGDQKQHINYDRPEQPNVQAKGAGDSAGKPAGKTAVTTAHPLSSSGTPEPIPADDESDEEKREREARLQQERQPGHYHEYSEAGVVIISAECAHTSCIDHFKLKKSNRPPDMFIIVDYGEPDRHGKYKRLGKLGQTDVVKNQHVADFDRTVISFRKHERSHHFLVRKNGVYHIQLYDKEPVLFEFVGGTFVNVTDTGLHSNVEAGIGNVSFEVFHSDH